ncbi:MAG TPA: GNAT family N-acetyltransferase [Aequorivita sp.]|nr:GNAT family N-acetyltransferase [Aequorivita sp.]
MDVKIEESGSKGFAIATEDGKTAGKMTYSVPSTNFIIIDHTEVDEAFGGKGVGKQLLYKIVAMAREKDLKIMPLCPFAAAMFKKLDDIQDVLKK